MKKSKIKNNPLSFVESIVQSNIRETKVGKDTFVHHTSPMKVCDPSPLKVCATVDVCHETIKSNFEKKVTNFHYSRLRGEFLTMASCQ